MSRTIAPVGGFAGALSDGQVLLAPFPDLAMPMAAGGWVQGDRMLNRGKCGPDLFEDVLVPAGAEPFAADVIFDRSLLLSHVKGHPSERGGDFGAGAAANPAGVFCQSDIEDVMQAVLDRPVTADVPGPGPDFRRVTADEVCDFHRRRSADGSLSKHQPQ